MNDEWRKMLEYAMATSDIQVVLIRATGKEPKAEKGGAGTR